MAPQLGYANPKLSPFSPAKPSRPSRAYIHVVSNEHIGPLSDQVRQSSFQDASHTSNDPVLLGPPTLEFAPYAKTPGSRVRKDARQGTIDQDPEFIVFLESLTQPITKPATVDSIEPEEKKAAVVTTPLVQFIKDKKASKAKESAASKSSKRSEKESKQEKVQAKKLLQRPDKKLAPGPSSDEKPKGEKAGKESGKAAKAAKAAAGGTTTKGGKASTSSTTKENTSAAASERKRERGNVAAAAKILQRDLGLSQAPSRRRGKGGTNEAGSTKNESSRESSVPAVESSKKDIPSKPAKSAASVTKAKDRDGESPSSRASGTATPPANATTTPSTKPPKGAKTKATASPTPTATQAFLKHANASQGVTEALLEAAFTPFGTVTKVEIDKKKGFGYVDFAEPEGLQKAMAASPVSVAQSQVVVLERKANPGGEKSRKGGGGGGGGGRGDTVQQQAKGEKAKTSAHDGNGAASGGGSGGGSSRGSRGGRGSRNKGSKGGDGSKGGTGSGTAAAASGEKSGGSDAK